MGQGNLILDCGLILKINKERRYKLSKADRIRKLFTQKEKPREIATIVNTSKDYVYNIIEDVIKGGGGVRRFRYNQKTYNLKHPDKKKKHRRRNYLKGRKNDFRSGKHWTKKEIEIILHCKGNDRRLAHKIGRSVQAIQVRRSKIKLLLRSNV